MRFVAIDVETANPDMASICQVGIASFENGAVVGEWVSLVDPEDDFDPMNVSIHGIDERVVRGQPTFPDIASAICSRLRDDVCVCHTHFDRVSLTQAFARYSLPAPLIRWMDTARVARRTWADCASAGYGLGNLCKKIGYSFRHHDALEDAKAAGHIMLAAIRESQLDLAAWAKRVNQPLVLRTGYRGGDIALPGNPDGPLAGEVVVLTGALSMPRVEAAEFAARAGCRVAPRVASDDICSWLAIRTSSDWPGTRRARSTVRLNS